MGGVLTARTSAEQSSRSNTINMSLSLSRLSRKQNLGIRPKQKEGEKTQRQENKATCYLENITEGGLLDGTRYP